MQPAFYDGELNINIVGTGSAQISVGVTDGKDTTNLSFNITVVRQLAVLMGKAFYDAGTLGKYGIPENYVFNKPATLDVSSLKGLSYIRIHACAYVVSITADSKLYVSEIKLIQ